MVSREEIGRRYALIREAMAEQQLDAVLVCGSEYTGFEGAITYLSGFVIVHRYAYVLLPREGDPTIIFPAEARYVGEHGTSWIEDQVFADRPGKYLADTATEVLIQLKPAPQRLFADSAPTTGRANYLRFRISPGSVVALAARVKRPGKEFVGTQQELYLFEDRPGEEAPYERLLTDAMAGDGALFTREDAVEAAWAAVDLVLKRHHRVHRYRRGCWGPKAADALIASVGGWHNPSPEEH